MGNLASVSRALEECGVTPLVSTNPADLLHASHVIVPGVGAFHDAMANLSAGGWPDALKETAAQGVPLLGICLGMQLLAERGTEGDGGIGLGLIQGEVVRLVPESGERIPHVGWNELLIERDTPLLAGVPTRTDVYFVHSYHLVPTDQSVTCTRTPYCGSFVSSVELRNVFGTQFHPEKSSRVGRLILRNFVKL
jgi:glutamine amidotransferase